MLLWVSVKLLILPWLEPITIISPKAILLKQSSLLIHLSAYIFFSFSFSVVVVVVIFFTIFFLLYSYQIGLCTNFFWQTIANILHMNRIFFFSFFLRPITLIFASNFNLSTICQNNLAQDHPPWIFFSSLSLYSSHSHFYLLIFKRFQFREQCHRWLPSAPQNSHSPLKTN